MSVYFILAALTNPPRDDDALLRTATATVVAAAAAAPYCLPTDEESAKFGLPTDHNSAQVHISSEHGRQNDIHATGVDKGWGGGSRPRPQYCQVIYRKRDGWRDFFVFLEITVVWLRYPAAGWPRSRFEF